MLPALSRLWGKATSSGGNKTLFGGLLGAKVKYFCVAQGNFRDACGLSRKRKLPPAQACVEHYGQKPCRAPRVGRPHGATTDLGPC